MRTLQFKTVCCVLLISIVVAVTTGCLRTVPAQLPNTDIVFQTMAYDNGQGYSFAFVNADGSDLTVVELNQGVGAAILPAWSADGKTLIFRGEVRIPDVNYLGRFFVLRAGQSLTMCPPEHTQGGGPLFITADGKQAVMNVAPELPDKLVLLNLNNCEITNTFLTVRAFGGAITSSKREVVFWQEEDIGVFDLDFATHTIVGHGIAPRWSPDDQWIAYTGRDGIYVVKRDGTGSRRIVLYKAYRQYWTGPAYEDWPPLPSWSPDGKWLVYHKCMLPDDQVCEKSNVSQYAIFKVNVETGVEMRIVDGGLNPYWRWRPK